MLALGAFEYGMAFREWATVSAATREGGRVASIVTDSPGDPDCLVLEATAGSLQSIPASAISEVWIYKSDTAGNVLAANRYRPKADTDPVSLTCGGADWFAIATPWPPAVRDNDGDTRDWIGVRVIFEHVWQTGFLWFNGSVTWSEDAVLHLEPAIT
jgi:hypothetical protein